MKRQYGDYVAVNGKPEGESLKEVIVELTKQMLDSTEALNKDINRVPITFVIKESTKEAGVWTVGWKMDFEE